MSDNKYLSHDIESRKNDLYAKSKYDLIKKLLKSEIGLNGIIDVGCGAGELCYELSKLGYKVTGIDPEEEYILKAKLKIFQTPHKPNFICSSIENYNSNKLFDIATTTDMLEHISNDDLAIKKVAQLVKKDGVIIVVVPAMPWLFGFHDESIGHYRRYSKKSIISLLSPYCKIEQVRYFGWTFIPICILFSKILKRSYPVSSSGDKNKNPFISTLLQIMTMLDKNLPLPFGTSLIVKARKIS
ncbi:MAG: methyltransferase domain-containing protein [bacterium]|nr:methyltransferase domain-containing protein [bacterium]